MLSNANKQLEEAFASCMKCGFCKAGCPVFLGRETTSPRAKVRLARAVAGGQIELTQGVAEQMDRCLNCRSCASECPSGVEPNKIALTMRRAVVERDGLKSVKKLIFHKALPNPKLMAWGLKVMGLGQHVLGLDMQNNPLRDILPFMGIRRDKDLPALGRRTLFSILPEIMEPIGEHKTTVVYFPGCATDLLYPEMGQSVVSVLRKLGARVILPHGLVCCGTPVFNSGDVEGARRLAESNIKLLSSIDADFIVTSCGSCGLTIKQEWSEILGLSNAEAIGKKVVDISEFIARYVDASNLAVLDDAEVVTYHDSCHLRRGLGVYKEPRQLLAAVLGDKFGEMESADRCCGGGGAFCLYHPELSQIVADVKMQCVEDSGAQRVATGCPACVMQLRDSFVHRKMPQRALHTIQIIDHALK